MKSSEHKEYNECEKTAQKESANVVAFLPEFLDWRLFISYNRKAAVKALRHIVDSIRRKEGNE